MQIIEKLSPHAIITRQAVVTFGNFDGVHRGHKALFERLKSVAKENNLATCVLTFQNHPLEVLRPDIPLAKLTAKKQKMALLSAIGFDVVIIPPFTKDIASLTPRRFIEAIQAMVPIHTILVGADVAFGANREGNKEVLQRLAKEMGFSVMLMEPILDDGQRISSTRIRARLSEARLDEVSHLLGRPYVLCGEVEGGLGVATKELGCPTLNMRLGNLAYPREGIYAGRVRLNDEAKWHPACVYIGRAGTLHPREKPLLEVNILDAESLPFPAGSQVSMEVQPVAFLRPDQIFATKEELMQQIHKDLTMAGEIMGEIMGFKK